jgi:hypothetical protein
MFSEKNPNMAHKLNIGEGRSTEIVFALPDMQGNLKPSKLLIQKLTDTRQTIDK